MKKHIDQDILIAVFDIITKYFVVQEFSGSKISSYEKAIYNALKLAIKGKDKNELFKKRQ
jgi:hypothetical protein